MMVRGFPIPEKKADIIVHVFINSYLPVHMCPHFILSDNGTELKNQLTDNALQQLGIDHILFPHIIHKVMENWRFSSKTLNLLLRNCEKDPDNWDKYINQVLASYCVTPHLTTAETPFFLVYGRGLLLTSSPIDEANAAIPQ